MAEEANAAHGTPDRIVAIAVDGSDNAKGAYKFYLSDIRKDGDEVYLLHSVEVNKVLQSPDWHSSADTMLPTLLEEEQEKTRCKLEVFAAWLRDDGVSGTVKSIHADSPGSGIIKAAEDIAASIIILGTRGLGTLGRAIFGSVSDYVLHHARVPVVIYRQDSEYHHQHEH